MKRDPCEILARRLGVPLSALRNPKVQQAFDEYFLSVRKILDAPPEPVILSTPPGAVSCSRAGNTLSTMNPITRRRLTDKFC
jgi:hypothetical protein